MKIQEYPREIERACQDLASVNLELAEVREQIRQAEIEALNSVITARTEDGKLIHTNDRTRDVAIHFALRADSSYCQDRATERILEHKRATLEAECERLRREYRIALIDYERGQLGRREVFKYFGLLSQ